MSQVYHEITVSVQALRDSADMTLMRENLPVIQQQKNLAIKDILSETQFARYTELLQHMRSRRRGNGGGQ
jgi:hypothetical protein